MISFAIGGAIPAISVKRSRRAEFPIRIPIARLTYANPVIRLDARLLKTIDRFTVKLKAALITRARILPASTPPAKPIAPKMLINNINSAKSRRKLNKEDRMKRSAVERLNICL
jgi:hypothetical protein